jgi:hypothetical protein
MALWFVMLPWIPQPAPKDAFMCSMEWAPLWRKQLNCDRVTGCTEEAAGTREVV